MKKIYLDNAATTALDPEVWEYMTPYFLNILGNPSSTHFAGREAKAALESARKKIATIINGKSARVIFTSGATEANNLVFKFAVKNLGIKTIITSPLEHHAVLHPAEKLEKEGANLLFTKHDEKGALDLDHLTTLLEKNTNALVSVMHVNNEIGIINPVNEIGTLCKRNGALFHSDTVQSLAHLPVDIVAMNADFIVSAAHKYHGPKGVGFLAFGQDFFLTPDTLGGIQEKGLRAGTEAVPLIMGMAKALENIQSNLEETENKFKELKTYLIQRLKEIPEISYHACSADFDLSIPSLINLSLDKSKFNEMTLFQLDLAGIAVSGGSACSSGAIKGSHVLSHLDPNNENIALRVSFSKYTTKEDLEKLVEVLSSL